MVKTRRSLLASFLMLFVFCTLAFVISLTSLSYKKTDALKLYENDPVALEVAEEGIVLLKNSTINGETKTLPIKSNMKVGVLGNGGSSSDFQYAGRGSTFVYSNTVVYPDDAFNEAASHNRIASFSKFTTSSAGTYDRVLYYIMRTSSESIDRTRESFELSSSEKSDITWLINRYGKEKVIVLFNVVSVTDTTWLIEQDVGAIVCIYNPGDQGGNAIVNVLTGAVSPSGKTVDTWAKSLDDYPTTWSFGDTINVPYYEDLYVGYKYFETFDKNRERVNYCFGFGLSYTTFEIKKNYVTVDDENKKIKIFVDVTNTGSVAGKEIVQIYFKTPNDVLDTPAMELITFEKTSLLAPGETETVELSFDIDDMAQYDDLGTIQKDAYIMQKGIYNIYLGNSVIDAKSHRVYQHVEETNRFIKQCTEITTTLTERLTSDGTYVKLNPYTVGYGSTVIDATLCDSHDKGGHNFTTKHAQTKWVGNSYNRYLVNTNTATFRYNLYVEKAGEYDIEFVLGSIKTSAYNDMLGIYLDYTDDGVDNGTKQNIVVNVIGASKDYINDTPFDCEWNLYQGYKINFTQTGWVTLYIVGAAYSKGTCPNIDSFTISGSAIKESGETKIAATNYSAGSGVLKATSVNGSYVKNCKTGNYVQYSVNATAAGTYYLSLFSANVIKATENLCDVYVNGTKTPGSIKLMRTAANPTEGATEDCEYRFAESSQIAIELNEGSNTVKISFIEDDVLTSLQSVIIGTKAKAYEYTDNTAVYNIKPAEAYDQTNKYEEGCTGIKGYKYADVVAGKCTVEEFLSQFTARQLMTLARLYWDDESNTNTGSFGANLLGQDMWYWFDLPFAGTADGSVGVRFVPSSAITDDYPQFKYSTCFPSIVMLCSTWNKKLAEDYGDGIAKEALAVNCTCVLGPGVNIHRNPLLGRSFEYFSEDGILSGIMVSHYIIGMESGGCMSSIKHFVGNEQENQRRLVNESISARALRQVYIKPFEIALKLSNPSTIMTSYNNVNGQPTWANIELLDNIILDELGYNGLIESDWDDDSNLIYMFRSRHNVLSMDHNGDSAYNEQLKLSYLQGDVSYDKLKENAKVVIRLLMHSGGAAKGLKDKTGIDGAKPTFTVPDKIRCTDGNGVVYEYLSNKVMQKVSKTQSLCEEPTGVHGDATLDGTVVKNTSSDSGAYYSIHVLETGTYYLSYILNIGSVSGYYGGFEVYIDGVKIDTFTNPEHKTCASVGDFDTVAKFYGDDGSKAIFLKTGLYRVYVKFTEKGVDFHKMVLSFGSTDTQSVSKDDGILSNYNCSSLSEGLKLVNGNITDVAPNKSVEYKIVSDSDYDVVLAYNVKVNVTSSKYFDVYLDNVKIDTLTSVTGSGYFEWLSNGSPLRLGEGSHTIKVIFLASDFEFGGVEVRFDGLAGNKFKININNDQNKGSVTGINGTSYYKYDSTVNITVNAKDGYYISSVTWNGADIEVLSQATTLSFNADIGDSDDLAVSYGVIVPSESEISMVTGVSVKLTANGLRYRTLIGNELYDSVKNDNTKQLGILIFPTVFIENDTTIIGNYHAALKDGRAFQALDITVDKDKLYQTGYLGDVYWCANGVLHNVKLENRDLAFTAVGYVYDGTTYTYATQNSAKSLYKAINALYFAEDATDRAEYRAAFENVYDWFGTEDYPIVIDTTGGDMTQYDIVVADIAAGNTYENKYFKISEDVVLPAGSTLIGAGFAGKFTADSKVVSAKTADTVIDGFDYAQSYAKLVVGTGNTIHSDATEWLTEYKGETGVVKMTWPSSSNEWTWFSFIPENEVSSYKGYKYMKIRMYVTDANNFDYFVIGNDNTFVYRDVCLNDTFVTGGAWVDYYFATDAFLHWWDGVSDTSANYTNRRVWSHSPANTTAFIYVSSIEATNGWTRAEAKEGEINDITAGAFALGQVDCTGKTASKYLVGDDDIPKGATHGVANFTVSAGTKVKVNARQTFDKYYAYYYVTFAIKFHGTGTVNITTYPGGGVSETQTCTAGSWTTLDIKIKNCVLSWYFDDASLNEGWFTVTSGNITAISIYSVTATVNPLHEEGKFLNVQSENHSAVQKIIRSDAGDSSTWYNTEQNGVPIESGYGGYFGLPNTNDKTWFNLRINPTCSFEEFCQYDNIEFRIYVYGGNYDTVRVTLYNRFVTNVTKNTWTTVKLPIHYFYDTQHTGNVFNNIAEFYYFRFTSPTLLLSHGGENLGNVTLYIEDISLTRETTISATENNFVDISNDTLSSFRISGNAAPEMVGGDAGHGRTAVKLTSDGDRWDSVWVARAVTVGAFNGHTHLKISLYIEGGNGSQLYEQNTYKQTKDNQGKVINDAYYYTTSKMATPPENLANYSDYKIPSGEWVDIYMPLKHLGKVWSYHIGDNPNQLFIFRGNTFTAVYISSITLV